MKRVLRDLNTLLQSPEREYEHLLTADGADNELGLTEFIIVDDEYFRGDDPKTTHGLKDVQGIKLDGDISKRDMISLCSAMIHENCPEEMRIDLSGCQFEDGAIQVLAEAMKSGDFPKHVSLDMNGCNIDDSGAMYLADALKSENNIDTLQLLLGNNNIEDNGLLMLGAALSSPHCPQTFQLQVHDNLFTAEGGKAFYKQFTPGYMPKRLNPITLGKSLMRKCGLSFLAHADKLKQNDMFVGCIEALQEEGTHCKVKLDASALRLENIDKLVKNLVDSARKRPTEIKLKGYVRPEYIQAFQQKIQEAPYLPNLIVKGIDISAIQESNRIRDTLGVMTQGLTQEKSSMRELGEDCVSHIAKHVMSSSFEKADKRMQHSIGVVTNIYKNRVQRLAISSNDSREHQSGALYSRTF